MSEATGGIRGATTITRGARATAASALRYRASASRSCMRLSYTPITRHVARRFRAVLVPWCTLMFMRSRTLGRGHHYTVEGRGPGHVVVARRLGWSRQRLERPVRERFRARLSAWCCSITGHRAIRDHGQELVAGATWPTMHCGGWTRWVSRAPTTCSHFDGRVHDAQLLAAEKCGARREVDLDGDSFGGSEVGLLDACRAKALGPQPGVSIGEQRANACVRSPRRFQRAHPELLDKFAEKRERHPTDGRCFRRSSRR